MANRFFTLAALAAAIFFAAPASATTVRVAIAKNVNSLTVSSEWPLRVDSGIDLGDTKILKISCVKEGFKLNGKHVRGQSVMIASSGLIKAGLGSYHGAIQLMKNPGGGAVVINHVDMEDYIAGVVAMEMGRDWPAEALKAQAIASRTFALHHMDRREGRLYDLDNTVSSQVYKGVSGVNQAVREAVFATGGLVAMFDGAPALTFYHSCAGGETEDLKYVWGRESRPYLTSQPAPFEDGAPEKNWRVRFSGKDIQARFAKYGVKAGPVSGVEILSRTSSGRARAVRVTYAGKHRDMNAAAFRRIMGENRLRSTKFTVDSAKKGEFVFTGEGYGHAVGMSQWSARGMAEHGLSFDDIIGHFYPGVEITPIDGTERVAMASPAPIPAEKITGESGGQLVPAAEPEALPQ
ncbi:MAG: SpoIID/LytB domain-containing protein [Nitrospinae bacterium]|nr:SpoIID/LytB domain-containing protein [Nitrospinota bacterium]